MNDISNPYGGQYIGSKKKKKKKEKLMIVELYYI